MPIDGQEELIGVAANQVLAYDPASGSELWTVRFDGFSNVARPVYGAGLLFISTGYEQASLWGIRPEGSGDISATNVVWKNTKDAAADPSPVFHRRIALCRDRCGCRHLS